MCIIAIVSHIITSEVKGVAVTFDSTNRLHVDVSVTYARILKLECAVDAPWRTVAVILDEATTITYLLADFEVV